MSNERLGRENLRNYVVRNCR
ncbi:unnamed protein product [Phyllotreta striolata]|uniref:Uncharacterized protein n=1 Tax=Phyllotreta striolata TaxID=444603 RepID=A0A9N9TGZ6_PHYSR|nr:unnamed protein product [Phyllotreta striolata]